MDILSEQVESQSAVTGLLDWYNNLDLLALDIILIVGLLISWAALVGAFFIVINVKKQASMAFRLQEKLVHDLQIAGNGAIGMGQRIIALEKRLANSVSSGQSNDSRGVKKSVRPALKSVPKATQKQAVKKLSKVLATENKKQEPLPAMFSEKSVLNSSQTNSDSVFSASSTPQKDDPFERAKAMLRRGAAQVEVAKKCGLSLSEAALMAMVLDNKSHSKTAALVAS